MIFLELSEFRLACDIPRLGKSLHRISFYRARSPARFYTAKTHRVIHADDLLDIDPLIFCDVQSNLYMAM